VVGGASAPGRDGAAPPPSFNIDPEGTRYMNYRQDQRYEKRGGQLVLLPTPPSLGIPRMQWIGREAAGALLRHPEWEVIRP
jgi:hypothetical protein